MKKIFYLAGACCMSLCLLGACSSDDDPVKPIELAEAHRPIRRCMPMIPISRKVSSL